MGWKVQRKAEGDERCQKRNPIGKFSAVGDDGDQHGTG
jgi:hypothetical protein